MNIAERYISIAERYAIIAECLGVSPHTAKKHTVNIRRKLGLRSFFDLYLWALAQAEQPESDRE